MHASEDIDALVIGGGPAGLMAAETLATAGRRAVVAEAKPTLGRKLLLAGKSGLNLTKDEPLPEFVGSYGEGRDWLHPILAEFGPEAVVDWASSLGTETFVGSSGRVFPRAMKASPLLRAWLRRLEAAGVDLRPRWRWLGWDGARARFDTPEGERYVRAGVTVLALGGASWPRLGSDGAWMALLGAAGVALAPLRASNVGFCVDWSPAMARHFGEPVKAVRLGAGGRSLLAEFVISAGGVEGGGIYALGPELREGADLVLDLVPARSEAEVEARLARPRGSLSLGNHLRRTLNLPPVKIALLREEAPASLGDPAAMARALKALPLPLAGPRPLAEAISTAGGVRSEAVDAGLGLVVRPDIFVAGEMLDWDAPTGGYLLTACLATGRHAGRAAAAFRNRAPR